MYAISLVLLRGHMTKPELECLMGTVSERAVHDLTYDNV